MNITETISLLDELSGLLALYDKKRERGLHITGEEEDAIKVIKRSIDTIEHLRQAALDGERYRKEAEAGRIVEEIVRSINQRREETREIFAKDPDFARGYIQAYAEMGRNFAHAYRQAVEQKEV